MGAIATRPHTPRRHPAASAIPADRWHVLAWAWLVAVNCRAPLFALSPYLDQVIPDLGLSYTVAGLLPSASLVLMGLLALPGGLLADHYGPRRAVAVLAVLVALASLARALAPSALILLAATAVLGGSIGALQPALPSIARASLPRRVGLATGLYTNGFTVGSFLATALSAALLAAAGPLGWRGALLAWTAFSAIAALGWLWLARGERAQPAAHRPETPGSPWTIWRAPGVPGLALAFACQAAIFYGLMSWLPAYLKEQGWSLEAIAGPLALMTLTAVPTGLVTPALADRLGRRPLLFVSGVVCAAGVLGFWLAPAAAIWAWSTCIGVGTTMAFSLALSGPAVYAPPARVGATAGAMLALGYVGSMLGPFLVGVFRDLAGDYAAGLLFLVLVSGLMAFSGFALPPEPAPDRPVH